MQPPAGWWFRSFCGSLRDRRSPIPLPVPRQPHWSFGTGSLRVFGAGAVQERAVLWLEGPGPCRDTARGCCRAMLGHSPAPGPGRARRRCAGKTKSNPWESCSPPATTTSAVNRISNGCFSLFPRSLQLIKVPLCHSLCVYLRQWKGAVVPAAPRCRAGSLAQTH